MNLCGWDIPVVALNTLIVGSGAAGLSAADALCANGQADIAILTEGTHRSTSRNTGSDKQTYYKLSLSGGEGDSVLEMAQTYFQGGCMHGDLALVEAAGSARCFFRLLEMGVPFPQDRFGQYAGYKTDHDPRRRAASAGPLTSRYMTERLEERARARGVRFYEGWQAVRVLTDGNRAAGVLAVRMGAREPEFLLFHCANIVYATGGPAGMYAHSVYPAAHTGASGIALEAGVEGVNLTEWQFGIASTAFRWNVSGTYMQALPRFVSTNPDGSDEREFLDGYFPDPAQMLDRVFLKGYQWPFDARKAGSGSSLIDLFVFYESRIKNRRVFLDFTRDPSRLDFAALGGEAREYLEKSGALRITPIERLRIMNPPAIELYLSHGIDLTRSMLEIAVCAQHNNGGLCCDIFYQSNIEGFFPIGEAAGVFGVTRPGGSALNSTQVGALRCAQFIAANRKGGPNAALPVSKVKELLILCRDLRVAPGHSTVSAMRRGAQARMSRAAGILRSREKVAGALAECQRELTGFSSLTILHSPAQIPSALKNRDILLAQCAYLAAMLAYIDAGGGSRGSCLIHDRDGEAPNPSLPDPFRHKPDDGALTGRICHIRLNRDYSVSEWWEPVRGIPETDDWFENVWNQYRRGAHNR